MIFSNGLLLNTIMFLLNEIDIGYIYCDSIPIVISLHAATLTAPFSMGENLQTNNIVYTICNSIGIV